MGDVEVVLDQRQQRADADELRAKGPAPRGTARRGNGALLNEARGLMWIGVLAVMLQTKRIGRAVGRA